MDIVCRLVLALMLCAPAALAAGQDDLLTRARNLAVAGQRGESIALLEDALTRSPRDSEARVLLGTVLSWEGRYDEARRELDAILADNPTHGDALPAMINVELWSNHPGRAETLAARALGNRPDDTGLLLARARALRALERHTEARATIDRLLAIEPRNEPARQIRRDLDARLRPWQVRVGSSYDGFSGNRAAWHEAQLALGRTTPIGLVVLKGARAHRFGLQDDQIEIEAYPSLRRGTHAYVTWAYSPDAVFYPAYRYTADLHQSLGGGFEAAAGFRRLGFDRGVNVYAASLSKYHGNWLFTGRAFVMPRSTGPARSYHGVVRRYFGDAGTYVGLRYGRGAWRGEIRNRDDFEVLDSDVGGSDAVFVLLGRLELTVSGSYRREDRVERAGLRHYAISSGLGIRF